MAHEDAAGDDAQRGSEREEAGDDEQQDGAGREADVAPEGPADGAEHLEDELHTVMPVASRSSEELQQMINQALPEELPDVMEAVDSGSSEQPQQHTDAAVKDEGIVSVMERAVYAAAPEVLGSVVSGSSEQQQQHTEVGAAVKDEGIISDSARDDELFDELFADQPSFGLGQQPELPKALVGSAVAAADDADGEHQSQTIATSSGHANIGGLDPQTAAVASRPPRGRLLQRVRSLNADSSSDTFRFGSLSGGIGVVSLGDCLMAPMPSDPDDIGEPARCTASVRPTSKTTVPKLA